MGLNTVATMATGCVRTIVFDEPANTNSHGAYKSQVSVLLPKVGQISPISIGQPDAPSAGYAVLSIESIS